MRESQLPRFITAQNDPHSGFDAALEEIQAGRKVGHWIWYVFPQLSGLGVSTAAQHYGLRGIDEAVEYLRHPVLCSRLLGITTAVADQLRRGTPVERLMGSSTDALKLVSSLTLFGNIARRVFAEGQQPAHESLARAAENVLAAAAAQGYPPCRHTLDQLQH